MFRHCTCFVNFVAQHDDGYFLQLWHLEHSLQLVSALFESFGVAAINQINYAIDVADVVSPCFSGSFMASQIPSFESYFSYIILSVPITSSYEYGC
jgi:hypothetical protein